METLTLKRETQQKTEDIENISPKSLLCAQPVVTKNISGTSKRKTEKKHPSPSPLPLSSSSLLFRSQPKKIKIKHPDCSVEQEQDKKKKKEEPLRLRDPNVDDKQEKNTASIIRPTWLGEMETNMGWNDASFNLEESTISMIQHWITLPQELKPVDSYLKDRFFFQLYLSKYRSHAFSFYLAFLHKQITHTIFLISPQTFVRSMFLLDAFMIARIKQFYAGDGLDREMQSHEQEQIFFARFGVYVYHCIHIASCLEDIHGLKSLENKIDSNVQFEICAALHFNLQAPTPLDFFYFFLKAFKNAVQMNSSSRGFPSTCIQSLLTLNHLERDGFFLALVFKSLAADVSLHLNVASIGFAMFEVFLRLKLQTMSSSSSSSSSSCSSVAFSSPSPSPLHSLSFSFFQTWKEKLLPRWLWQEQGVCSTLLATFVLCSFPLNQDVSLSLSPLLFPASSFQSRALPLTSTSAATDEWFQLSMDVLSLFHERSEKSTSSLHQKHKQDIEALLIQAQLHSDTQSNKNKKKSRA